MRYGLLFSLLLATIASAEVVPGRYIVELTGDSVSDHMTRRRARGGMQSAEASTRRAAIRQEHASLRARMGTGVSVDGSVENVGNALLVTVDDAQAARLAGLAGVRRVIPVRTVKRLLDRAVVVNRITEAWDQIGDDKAGDGIRIAIIDTGVDNAHAALRDNALTAPASFPKTNAATDESFTSNKVIVARSYVNLLARRDSDTSARDHVGHGTALAVIAAGVRTAAPLATIQGVAPRAYIGSYKVFGTPGVNDGATNAAILKAIDDAVADGMDIINLSLGDDVPSRQDEDPLAVAVEKASQAGVIVVCAAGNNGPDYGTIASPGTARSAISVGATRNDRTFGTSVAVEGGTAFAAIRGSGAPPADPVTGPLADVSKLDSDGLGCNAFPSGSLTGKVALILRGTCLFEVKLNNAERAGAVGAIVYARPEAPDAFGMNVGAATLPAESVSNADGLALKPQHGANVTLRFTLGAIPQEYNRLASFSAIGPNVDLSIKPEVTAVGESFYVATQSADANGDMYSSSGYALVDGTSFSTPLVAGSLALLKAARPGLTVDQYRSLLVNTATDINDTGGIPATIQRMGAGQMNLLAALRSPAAAVPATLSLGASTRATGTLQLQNLGADTEIYTLSLDPRNGSTTPVLSETSITIAAGQSKDLSLALDATTLPPGAYEGFVRATTSGGAEIRVPYWFAVPDRTPATIPLLSSTATGRRNAQLRDAILFRVTDSAGVPISGFEPQVTVLEGGGSVTSVDSYNSDSPGLFGATVRLGPVAGVQTFRITAGDKTLDVSITAN